MENSAGQEESVDMADESMNEVGKARRDKVSSSFNVFKSCNITYNFVIH